MTGDQYISGVISKYKQQTGVGSKAYKAAQDLFPAIQNWAGEFLEGVYFSGSYAKETGVNGSADLDLFISLASSTPHTLAEIYDKLFDEFNVSGLSARKQNVSIGITYKGLSVDLVPGKKRPGNTNYHSLYKSKTNSWIQTNIQEHIRLVKQSGRLDEIRGLKIWRQLHNLAFPSIYLELTVVQALKYKNKNQLAINLWTVLEFLRDNFIDNVISDPVNTNNIISDDLYKYEKQEISKKAGESLNQTYWENIIW